MVRCRPGETMAWRWVNRAAGLLLALVVFALLAGGYLFYRAMPAYSGADETAGPLGESSGLARRLWRSAHLRRLDWTTRRARSATSMRASACSRWRSCAGSVRGGWRKSAGADLLGVDKFIRTFGFYREAETSFSALSPWAQKRLHAYADGVNAFLKPCAAARIPPRRRPSRALEAG